MSNARRVPVEDDVIRSAKETLITQGLRWPAGERQPEWLPREIDRSWRRSISAGATRKPDSIHYVNTFDADSELCRAARPVLDRLGETLRDLDTAVFLADRTGQIVARRVPGRSARARFDAAGAAEGFDFSEQSIGTNGLGTAMQEEGAVLVRGPEHFNEVLERLACAGTGIRHPGTGRLVGSLSLAAAASSAETMMLALAREGARQIVENLAATAGRRELALGRCYRRFRSRGPVIVLSSDTVMTNVTGLSFLDVESHARLWEALLAKDWSRGPHVLELDLEAAQGRVLAHRVDDLGGEPAFAVEILGRQGTSGSGPRVTAADPFVARLQRVGGTGPLAVTGPGGSGRLHVAREWLRSAGHSEPVVLDAGDAEGWGRAREALRSGGAVVLRRLENLPDARIGAVKTLADGLGPGARLVITADQSRCSEAALRVLSRITVGAELPPLARRARDVPSLVQALLKRFDARRRPVLSAATMQVLLRWHWPGNVAELRRVVEDLAREFPGRPVSPYHLPERMWEAAGRRALTRMESAERSEIVAALRQAGGNRSRAASLLGIGRTTLYRKLRVLGIGEDALAG